MKQIRRLAKEDTLLLRELVSVFAAAFDYSQSQRDDVPGTTYMVSLLAKPDFFALVALDEGKVIGGLTAYELPLATSDKKELYIYDLAVDVCYRKQGIATALLQELKIVAGENGISLIFVEAESADEGAVAFYKSLRVEQLSVEHFNIAIPLE
jgi:aminoglycoside 3-N-acetyltransferase I